MAVKSRGVLEKVSPEIGGDRKWYSHRPSSFWNSIDIVEIPRSYSVTYIVTAVLRSMEPQFRCRCTEQAKRKPHRSSATIGCTGFESALLDGGRKISEISKLPP